MFGANKILALIIADWVGVISTWECDVIERPRLGDELVSKAG